MECKQMSEKETKQEAIEAFRKAKYGLMLHFGLYSLLEGSYRGMRGPSYAEWIECYHKIPNKEIEALAKIFHPIGFDADKICAFAKECGMNYLVLTAKHHEGFALFRSKADSFNCFDFSPFKRDIVGELSASAKKYGLKFGLYYSQVIDWHEEHGGGYLSDPAGAAGPSWENSWDFPDKAKKDYSICFRNKILPQIEELCTNYGEIFLFWFDMPLDSTKENSEEIYRLVKRLQPNCLINSRLGNGEYDYVSLGDNEIPSEIPQTLSSFDQNDIWGFKPSPFGLYESACTLNRSWGYSALDQNWKSPEEIASTRKKLEALKINYLINIGPDHLGRIPPQAREILLEAKRRYQS